MNRGRSRLVPCLRRPPADSTVSRFAQHGGGAVFCRSRGCCRPCAKPDPCRCWRGARSSGQWSVVSDSEEGWKTGGQQSRKPENEKTGREEGREAVAGGSWGRMGNRLNHGLNGLNGLRGFHGLKSFEEILLQSLSRSLSRSLSIRLISVESLLQSGWKPDLRNMRNVRVKQVQMVAI